MSKENPGISVIIATYNDEKYIYEAVMSILNQTFTDLELIIVNDASTDGTLEVINTITDPRIRVLVNESNRGLAYSLNRGIEVARGKYIARMDGDDISLPERLSKQFTYMEHHKEISICGCNYKAFGKEHYASIFSEDSDSLKARMLFYSPLGHSTWFIRKSDMHRLGMKYDEKFRSSQDYELLLRMLKKCQWGCVQEVLLLYRVRKGSITTGTIGIDKNTLKVQKRILKFLNIPQSRRNCILLNQRGKIKGYRAFKDFVLLAKKIIKNNKMYGLFEQKALEQELKGRIWENVKEHSLYLVGAFRVLTIRDVILLSKGEE